MKSCALTLALIWNHPQLYTSCCDEVISMLLKAKNDLWISWKSGLVRHTELKFLPEAYLTRSTHPWKFQPERTILRGKSFVGGGGRHNMPSAIKLKKERMTRSKYFHELIMDGDKFNGGQRYVRNSKSRTGFQWPYHIQQNHRQHLPQ